MNRTDSDRLQRVRGNLAAYERVLDDPAMPFDAPHWAGVLAVNVKELLDMVDRMDAAGVAPHDEGTSYCTGIPGDCPLHPEPALAPSGTGWPVTP